MRATGKESRQDAVRKAMYEALEQAEQLELNVKEFNGFTAASALTTIATSLAMLVDAVDEIIALERGRYDDAR